jgi:hypothetical protein
MSTQPTRLPSPPQTRPRISTDTWAILLATALGLLIRFGIFKNIAW